MGVSSLSYKLLNILPGFLPSASRLSMNGAEFIRSEPAFMGYGASTIQLPAVVALPLYPGVYIL